MELLRGGDSILNIKEKRRRCTSNGWQWLVINRNDMEIMPAQRIGILGSTGFIGRNLERHLTSTGKLCFGTSRRLGVDARRVRSLINWISDHDITHLINLAADCGGIGLNAREPARLWHSTTLVSAAVLEAARLTRIQKVTMVGTVCSYAKDCRVPFREESLMHYGPPEETNRAYAVAKLSALYGGQAYAQQYGISVSCLLPSNTYGPYDHFGSKDAHVIPSIIHKFMDAKKKGKKKVRLWGTGQATRDFIYVGDLVRAIELSLTSNYTDPLNIGTGKETSIRQTTEILKDIIGFDGVIQWNTDRPDGQSRRLLDVSLAKEKLGFTACTPLRQGLKKTVQWITKELGMST